MRRKQWGTLLLGVLSLAADCFAAGIQYLDRRYVYGNPPEGIAEMVHFFAPYGLFAAGVAALVVFGLFCGRWYSGKNKDTAGIFCPYCLKKGENTVEKLIAAEHLSFHYTDEEGKPASPEILKDLTLTLEAGSFVAVLGHNGCGKSTLAKHMNAILLPTGGKMWIAGIDTCDEEKLYEIRQHVGMVFQNPDNQIVATIVEEDVAFGPENLGLPPETIRERVDDALKAVGMYEYRMHAPNQLSGGQKQRIAIAGIIAMRPSCIVLDEPTAMLDPKGRMEVMKTIRMLNRSYDITIVLITHYMEEAAQADRVIVMDDGNILLDDRPEEVFSHVEQMKAIGLDVPQVTELVYELRQQGIPLDSHIISEDAGVEAILQNMA